MNIFKTQIITYILKYKPAISEGFHKGFEPTGNSTENLLRIQIYLFRLQWKHPRAFL